MPLSEEHAALIPEEIRNDPSLQSFNDIGGIAKGFVDTKALVGSSIRLPSKDSKPEDVEKWTGETSAKLKDHGFTIAKLNEAPPATPDAYDFKIEGVTPEQIKGDKALTSFRSFAHKTGLNNATANSLVEWYQKEAVPMLQEALQGQGIEMVEEAAQVEKVLAGVFKNETKEVLTARDSAINQLKAEIPELEDFLGGTAPYGKPWMTNKDHPAMVKLLKFVAEAKQPDFGGNVDGLTSGDTIDSINTEIANLRANKELSSEEIGRRLEPLYKKKAALMGMKKAS